MARRAGLTLDLDRFDAISRRVPLIAAARVVQTSAHLASGSNAAIAVRSTFFSVQLAAFVWMGALVVVHAAAK